MWFQQLTGFDETSPEHVREMLAVEECDLVSCRDGRRMRFGRLERVSLSALRAKLAEVPRGAGELSLREIVADTQALHADAAHAGALFQVASQFNLLEMPSPDVTPEHGVDGYERDLTQGPACAMAAGAGTIYRNYFADVDGQIGQSADRQIDCPADLGRALGNADGRLWSMRNGYALPSETGLELVTNTIDGLTSDQQDELRGRLEIGIQWETQVTLPGCDHHVHQAYCSALPIAYCDFPKRLWTSFAQLILDAAYEATFAAAAINAARTGNRMLFLTLLGGGAFGNLETWIIDAIRRSAALFREFPLDVRIVSYRFSNGAVRELVDTYG